MSGNATWSLLGAHGPAHDFALDDHGRLILDRTAATPMVTALLQHLDAWWAFPAHGSRIARITSGEPEPAGALESAVREALAPLERQRRIQDIDVRVVKRGSSAHITVSVYDISCAAPITVEFDPP